MALSKLKSRAVSRDEARRRAVERENMAAYFYILKLKSGALYPGATTNLQRRTQEHFSGKGCLTTRKDPPVELAYREVYVTFGMARKREIQVKKWSFNKKSALVEGQRDVLKRLSKSRDD